MAESVPDRIHDTILESVADGVFTVDLDWRITSFNRAAEEITGVPRGEALGRRCCDVFRASICEAACCLRQARETERPVINRTVYIVDSGGERIPISVSAAILRDGEGRVIGGVETFRDLTLVEELRRELNGRCSFEDIVGRSAPMRKLFDLLPDVAASDVTVLIQGASGTGKELVARAIHDMSARRDRPFVPVNCAALPDTLLESELFGHVEGAFTGAGRSREGRFARAEGGTLFLDEIGDISASTQVRLLRVLQEREYEPLGSSAPVRADVRIVAATHRDLQGLVRDGEFREDLYYRVHVMRIEIPPLRDRRADIPLLIDHMIHRLRRRSGRDISGVTDEVLRRLMDHEFPGNVRELENLLEHAFVLCRGGLIEVEHLPPALQPAGEQPSSAPRDMSLREAERWLIEDALRRHRGHRTAAARALGIHPSTLFRKAHTLGIRFPDEDGRRRADATD